MVNVDFGPGTVLGFGLIAAGYLLVQTRAIKPELSRDADIFLSSVVMMAGGILVFQGWRLDPILLFAQASVITVATSFALETFKLRDVEFQQQEDERKRLAQRRRREYGFQSSSYGYGDRGGPSTRSLPEDGVVEVDPTWSRTSASDEPYYPPGGEYVYDEGNLSQERVDGGIRSSPQGQYSAFEDTFGRVDGADGEEIDDDNFDDAARDNVSEDDEQFWSTYNGLRDNDDATRWTNNDDSFDDSDWE